MVLFSSAILFLASSSVEGVGFSLSFSFDGVVGEGDGDVGFGVFWLGDGVFGVGVGVFEVGVFVFGVGVLEGVGFTFVIPSLSEVFGVLITFEDCDIDGIGVLFKLVFGSLVVFSTLLFPSCIAITLISVSPVDDNLSIDILQSTSF